MKKNFIKQLIFLFSRCAVVYVAVILILYFSVDMKRMYYKTMDYYGWVPAMSLSTAREGKRISTKNFRDAIHYYKSFLKAHPDSAGARSALAMYYFRNGQKEKAVRYYEQAIKNAKENVGWHYNLGVVHFSSGAYEQALVSFKEEVRLLGEKPPSPYKLADPYHPQLQRVHLKHIQTKAANSQLYIVLCYYHLKKYEAMHEEALKGSSEMPVHKDAFLYYGALAAFHLGENTSARLLLRQSIDLEKNLVESYELLLQILEKQKNTSQHKKIKAFCKNLEKTDRAKHIQDYLIQDGLYFFPPLQTFVIRNNRSFLIL